MTPFSIQFSDGYVTGSNATGPLIGQGQIIQPDGTLVDVEVRAFRQLAGLAQVQDGSVTRPLRGIGVRRAQIRIFGRTFSVPVPVFRPRRTFGPMRIDVPSALTLNETESSFPAASAASNRQRAVYDGTFRLHLQDGSEETRIPVQVILDYPPRQNAVIIGSFEGQMDDPIFLEGALPEVTATFSSIDAPRREGVALFQVENFTLSGNWS